jgi:hypothetical protein
VISKMHPSLKLTQRIKPDPMASTTQKRQGTATVELAVVLPLLMLLTFGTIEIADGFFFQQAIATAAYEGSREASRAQSTQERGALAVKNVLEARGITKFEVKFVPPVTRDSQRGSSSWCVVTAKRSSWSPIRFGYLGNTESIHGVSFTRQ